MSRNGSHNFQTSLNDRLLKTHINDGYNADPADLLQSVGGYNQEWKNTNQLGKRLVDYQYPDGMDMEEYLDVVLQKTNRIDFPIILDPSTASFADVAIHGVLRQRKAKSTVSKLIGYAKFMENHPVRVDFRNPSIKNFMKHMDYREQIEHAGYGALGREWDTMKMFLRAYGIPLSDWPYRPPSRPYYTAKTIPLPDQVNVITHLTYSKDSYENAFIQYILTHNFVIGWRIPSEPAIIKVSDVKLDLGEIIVTEPKKHHSTRPIDPKEIMANPRRKSFKNWIDTWRSKVENQYSDDYLYLTPEGKPFSKESLRMYLNRRAAPLIKQVFPEYHNYIARDFCAIARLIRTKLQYGSFDEFEVKEWLGHTKIQTTMSYVKDAKRYYTKAPYDWIYRVLKAKNNGEENTENQKTRKIGSFDPIFSERDKRTWRDSNPRSLA